MFDENTVTYPLDLSVKAADRPTLTVGQFGEPNNVSCDCRLLRNGGTLANIAMETLLTRRAERLARKKAARERQRITWCVRKRLLGDYHVKTNASSPTFYRYVKTMI